MVMYQSLTLQKHLAWATHIRSCACLVFTWATLIIFVITLQALIGHVYYLSILSYTDSRNVFISLSPSTDSQSEISIDSKTLIFIPFLKPFIP